MNYLSVCSGIEAASVAWHPLGWNATGFSEIEKFPSAVLAHHYPTTPNHGDMTKFQEWPDAAIDVLVGGTPCQSFSVAGLRKGLDDPRGNLMLTYLAIARRYRPEWMVWENVPGVLSSNCGRDFGTFLGGLGQLGYGFAYRVLDAQYCGVAQRRRRVFVVANARSWRRAAAVLFERHSLSGHPAPCRETGQGIAGTTGARTGISSGAADAANGHVIASTGDVSHCLNAGGMGRQDYETETLISHSLRGEGFDASEDGTGRCTPLVPVAFSCKDHGADAGDVSPTLRSMGHDGGHANAGGQVAVAFQSSQSGIRVGETHATLDANNGPRRHNGIIQAMAVRRLTPRECERLQGFPETQNCFIIRVCRDLSDLQKANAHAALLCRKSPSNAGPVGECTSTRFANAADAVSNTLLLDLASRAAVSVQIDLERGAARLSSPERSHSSVEDADERNLFPLPTGIENFARLAALLTRAWETAIRTGRAASQASINPSTPAWIGSGIVLLSGREIAESASGAEKSLSIAATLSTSTISDAGQISPNFASTLETLSYCVAHAIAGFIPQTMLEASSYDIALTTSCGFTAVPCRNKPAADGSRYKALGNSMAVPCMAWIGQRIDAVSAIAEQAAAA